MRAIILLLAAFLAFAAASSDKKVVCYFDGSSVNRLGNDTFNISYIDPKLCTHLIYAFVGLNPDGSIRVLDAWQDLPDNNGTDGFGRFNKLHELSPGTKTMVAIGGPKEEPVRYWTVVADPQTRQRLVQSVVAFLQKYGFDGFDVDWEYPSERGGVPLDKQNYVLLLKELREAFNKHGYILSAAVGAAEALARQPYLISEMSKYLHFINLKTYDLHGIWDEKTGINAPLYPTSWERGDERKLNVEAIIKYWLAQGAAPEKLILGVPLYGRGFTLSDLKNKGIGSPTKHPSFSGSYTQMGGILGYIEICEKIKYENWQVEWQKEQRVPFAHKNTQWVGYDDQRSIKEKADFAKKLGLGGMMVWSIETDDFKGICGEKYPLLKTINQELRNDAALSATKSVSTATKGTQYPEQPKQPQSQKLEPKCPEHPKQLQPEYPEQSIQSRTEYPEQPIQSRTEYPEQPIQSRTEYPEKPEKQAGGVCKQEGWARDPNDCTVFYYCKLFKDKFIEGTFNCPDSLYFDTNSLTCNYPQNVTDC